MNIKTIRNAGWTLAAALLSAPVSAAAQASDTKVVLTNPIKANNVGELIDLILKIVFQVAIPFAVFMVIFAGFRLVLAQGNPAKVTAAKDMLLWTIVGLCVLLGATLIASVVKGTLCQIGSFEFCS
jgi:hypothetical protein